MINRRDALKIIGSGIASLPITEALSAKPQKKHFITLSFDDGFKKSSIRTAEIFEKYKLSACINVIATAHRKDFVLPNQYHDWPVGDFGLWNELQARSHEVMMHCYKHANLTQLPLTQAKDLVMKCIDIFSKELKGFNPGNSIFNFPYNASTPELEEWLPSVVKAFRTLGPAINPLPFRGQTKITCISHGPDSIDQDLNAQIDKLLSQPAGGWFIYNTHGLDEEGWGPLSSQGLDRLLARLVAIDTVEIIPVGMALAKA